jgi:hypothetical protein
MAASMGVLDMILDTGRRELHTASDFFLKKPCAFREIETFSCFGTMLYLYYSCEGCRSTSMIVFVYDRTVPLLNSP